MAVLPVITGTRPVGRTVRQVAASRAASITVRRCTTTACAENAKTHSSAGQAVAPSSLVMNRGLEVMTPFLLQGT